MRRVFTLTLCLIMPTCALLSCRSAPRPKVGDTPRPENLDIPKEMFDERTFVKQVNESGKIAKTIEWIDIGSKEGMTYLQGKIIIDQIVRYDAEDIYGVRIRLRNLTAATIVCETSVKFFDVMNNPIIGLHDGWKSIDVKALDLFPIENSSKTTGAVGFRLFIRPKGSDAVGVADFTGDTERLPSPTTKPDKQK